MTENTTAQVQALATRGYQQEMLEESLKRNIVIALDTGAGKTHVAVLRLKHEAERESRKVSWFLVPTVALAQQQRAVIATHVPVAVGLISGANEPDQWQDPALWRRVLSSYRIIVSTPDVLLNALRHGYIHLGNNIGFLVFDEAHHAADGHSYNRVMREFYDKLPPRGPAESTDANMRPMILGLTASPIFGGDAEKSLRQIERNLDATVCAPLLFRSELEGFVHRPQFKHIKYAHPTYDLVDPPPSSNLRSLMHVVATLNIEEDPWVINRRATLQRLEPGPERTRVDQRLSRAIDKHDTFAHKGLRDFERAAAEICSDLGAWAADWYIQQVCEQSMRSGDHFPEFTFSSSESERNYLLKNLARIEIVPVPEDDEDGPADVLRRTSDKVDKLIDVLLGEKAFFEGYDMDYRGLVFVTRRDAVLALAAVLARHPRTAHVLSVGGLLGESGNLRRRSFLDITRRLLPLPAKETLDAFRIGDLDLIIATAVAEEGLDIQACCNVVRWDPPANMVSWTQSRGRARQKRSSFVVMLSDSLAFAEDVRKWAQLEEKMTALYNTNQDLRHLAEDEENQLEDDDDDDLRFTVEATGAVLTGNSAVEHIFHFCSILPYSGHGNHSPMFDIDPPDYPFGWHAGGVPSAPYAGPYGCTLTLPKLVDPRFRVFSTPQIHATKIKARRYVAFQAYRALYDNGLLNEHLLPLGTEPEQEDEVRALLEDVEQRDSTARVSNQMDPWRVSGVVGERLWWSTILEADGLPPLRLLTQTALPSFRDDEFPLIHTRERPPFKVRVRTEGPLVAVDDGLLARARIFTRRIFWPLYGNRMKWDQMEFVHLFLPVDESPTVWDERRAALLSDPGYSDAGGRALFAPFSWWDQRYGHMDDFPIAVVTGTIFDGKPFQFVRWKNDPVTADEMDDIVRRYVRVEDDDGFTTLDINYPLIEARPFSKRNFLTPMPVESKGLDAASQRPELLLKEFSLVALISSHETQYALWAPSIIRHLQMASTTSSMRDTLFANTPLADIPLYLLMEASTTPAAGERSNYQRFETLGDTVLKYIVSIQLLSAHPLWHEGYLAKRKDHAVSNVNLSNMAVNKELYRWIIRDSFVPKRWRPRLASDLVGFPSEESPELPPVVMTAKQGRRASLARNLSTKVLADVVEALIGAAYLHGGFALGTECMKAFDLGLSWTALPGCIDTMYGRIAEFDRYPVQISIVESILGYTFRRKAIAVEALAHASYQSDLETISYERMEFLGDAVLDMLVTDYLYRTPGKEYSPGQMHMIKSAVVNAHFLAMLCLRASTPLPAAMPSWSQHDGVTVNDDTQHAYLWRCLLHSSGPVMDDQRATFARWERPGGQDEIEVALAEGKAFPWSALTSLQAPKFLSDMFESLLGAVYLDSLGDLDVVREVLRRLGHWEVLERIVARDMDVRHPVSRLYIWAGQHQERVKCGTPVKDGKKVKSSVLWDDFEVAKVEHEWRGRISQENARFAVAEKAIALLENPVSLLRIWLAKRNRSIEYSMNVVEGVPVCAAIVDGIAIATVQSRDRDSEEEIKQAAAAEALKVLEAPVHWLAFLSVKHRFEVEYQIYEEEGSKVCCVFVDGYEAGRVEYPAGPAQGPVVTEAEMTAAAARKAMESVDKRVVLDMSADNWEFEGADWA